jgi:hypothetical protein
LAIFIPCFTTEYFWIVYAIALCGFAYGDIHHSLLHFYYLLLFTVHDKIIMLMGTSRVDFAAMAVRRGIPALELPRNCSEFSKASGTL